VLDEEELVERAKRADHEAYALLVDTYKQRLFTYVYHMMNKEHDAEDMTQDVFIKAYTHLHTYTRQGSFWTWLSRIAYNHCIDELRKRSRIQFTPVYEDTLEPDGETPEKICVDKEKREELYEQVMALQESYRDVILLRHMQQLNYQEISEVLGIPVSTVQVRLHRARNKLRNNMIAQSKQGGVLHEMLDV